VRGEGGRVEGGLVRLHIDSSKNFRFQLFQKCLLSWVKFGDHQSMRFVDAELFIKDPVTIFILGTGVRVHGRSAKLQIQICMDPP
jgi:hypothetical protein